MKKYLLLLLCLSSFSLHAVSKQEIFSKFLNYYFVETGTHDGKGVQCALHTGYKEIHSIELSAQWAPYCNSLFQKIPRVQIWQGDSAILLENIITYMNDSITFWLDAHYSGPGTAQGEEMSPLLSELDVIKRHPLCSHTIIIGDMHLAGTEAFGGITKAQIEQKLLEINPDYIINYGDENILVAYLPQKWNRESFHQILEEIIVDEFYYAFH